MTFTVEKLPQGLSINPTNGQITGYVAKKGDYDVLFRARNADGETEKRFRIVAGDKIALTPPMGWNSWNCWAEAVDQQKVLDSARAVYSSGLIDHGWAYINIDDTWQGERGGKGHALQPNAKFPNMKALCDEIHGLGLKAGIYSTPWITSYAGHAGGSSDDSGGTWSKSMGNKEYWRSGRYSFERADADQLAAWGFDYLKYDWNPIDVGHVEAMSVALRKSGRDIVFSLSNTASFDHAADWAQWANCWRTTCDIWDNWTENPANDYNYGVSEIAFAQDKWASYGGPGHWNDPDMLVVGYVGWGPQLHLTNLSPDEQYTHITMWCMLSAPLLIGCDLSRLDPFTLNLLDNDEVLAIDQDALGRQATRVATVGAVDVYLKNLQDGGKAIAFFNRSSVPVSIAFNKLSFIGISGPQRVRDLWRQTDLPDIVDPGKASFRLNIAAHSAELYKLSPREVKKNGVSP